jgi:hypothetical protein
MTIYRLLDLKKARLAKFQPGDEYYCETTRKWFPKMCSCEHTGGYYECKTAIRRPVACFPIGEDIFLCLGEKLVKLLPEFMTDPDQTYATPTEIVAYLRRIEAAVEAESQLQKPRDYEVSTHILASNDIPSLQMKMTITKARSGSPIDIPTMPLPAQLLYFDPQGYRSHDTTEIKVEKKSVDPYVEHRQRLEALGVEKRVEVLIDPLAKPTLMVEIQYEDYV